MPRPGRMTTERAKDFKGTLRQLLSALSKYKLSLIVVVIFAVLSTIFNIAGPKILAKATTALATGWIAKLRGVGGIDFAYIGKVLLFLAGMYLLSAAFSFIQGWLMSGLSQKVCYDFRDQISKKINRLPLAYFEKRTVGEVLSRITNDVDTLGQSLNQSVTQLITSVTTMIGVLIMMLTISPKMTLIALLILPVSLALVSNMLQSMAAAAERVFEFLNEEEENQQADPAHRANPACIDGQVTFDHVKFGYTPEKTVIHNFSCNVKPGQKVAIVGPTGAGKTTMVKLLMRFYDVDAGEISLNGHNVRDFDRSALREGFGMVLQDTWLFKGTIMENIRYGRLDATDEEVIAAAKAANADHFIRTLPGGYQMELNEDASNVSQGQKQLLTIARTILADNRILILDEATSSVDTRTEQRIQTAMDRLMQGRTSFVIAHRLSTIRDADLILVMRDGDIVEQGTHDELIDQGGFYADLYNSQFEDVTA